MAAVETRLSVWTIGTEVNGDNLPYILVFCLPATEEDKDHNEYTVEGQRKEQSPGKRTPFLLPCVQYGSDSNPPSLGTGRMKGFEHNGPFRTTTGVR